MIEKSAPPPRDSLFEEVENFEEISTEFGKGVVRPKVPSQQGGMSTGVLIGLISLLLAAASLVVGMRFWVGWLTSVDRIVCSLFVAMGLFYGIWQSHRTPEGKVRWGQIGVLWVISGAILAISVVTGRPKLTGISMGLAFAALFTHIFRGERVAHAISLGMAFMVPTLVATWQERGYFGWAEATAVQITSGLADALQQYHFQEENTIRFGHGVVSEFTSEGKWDSIITLLGICIFCIYSYRRGLLNGLITLSLSFIVWMAVRGVACVALACLAWINGEWTEWTIGLEVGLFFIGAALIFSLDQFFAAIFSPIPVECINTDFPLFAVIWNWIVGLPRLTTELPDRVFQSMEIQATEEGL